MYPSTKSVMHDAMYTESAAVLLPVMDSTQNRGMQAMRSTVKALGMLKLLLLYGGTVADVLVAYNAVGDSFFEAAVTTINVALDSLDMRERDNRFALERL